MAVRFLPLDSGDPTEVAGYALRARLGTGGMGTVYLSFTRGGRPIAVKVVKREFADDPEFRRRFAREISAAQRVQGHFTAAVLDANPDAPVPWLATAYIAGPSLQRAVSEHGPLPLFTVFRLLAGAAEGIAAVHAAGLIHRDLKPANVLLAEDGPRVIDFGIAHAANSSTLTGKGNAIGTPGYMAPEQIRGKVTEATDVFGLGNLALYAATGHAAFGEGLTETLFYRILNEPPDLEDCPAELRPIVQRCLAKEPLDRPGTAEVIDYARGAMRGQTMRVVGEPWLPQPVAAALRDYAPSAAPPPPPPAPRPGPHPATEPVTPPGRKRLPRRALTILAVAILAIGGYLGYQVGHSGNPGSNPGTGAGAPPSARSTHTPTAAAASTSVQATAPPVTTAPPATSSSYPLAWAARQFTMPGDGCSTAGDTPSYVTFDATNGPIVNSVTGDPGGDLYIDCTLNSSGTTAGINFDNDQAARVSGTPSPGACDQAVNTRPLADADIPYSQLSVNAQYCVVSGQPGDLLVLLTLQAVNNNTDDLTWSATAWSLPASS